MHPRPDLIVFCHLPWEFVWQRPQHLLTRLAASRRIWLIEEPLPGEGRNGWAPHRREGNITICRAQTLAPDRGFNDEQIANLRPLLRQLLQDEGIGEHVAWFYTPMAFPLLDALTPQAVVYDCMDELSAFRHAPAQMIERETALLRAADVVFTGGPSLYRAKRERHSNAHCFPSSVDLAHFRKALGGSEPAEQAPLAHPRLGFFGVIDERFDVPLLDDVATSRPNWQLAIVGPVVKIDPASLPRRPNIHYFGQRSYQDLPAFLSGWDVCLLPFARNEATRFISPTKTLEYMAAELPIVSTDITDVAEPYAGIVEIAHGSDEFIAACERALSEPPLARARRVARMRSVLEQTSWDRTAAAMSDLIDEAVEVRHASRSAPYLQAFKNNGDAGELKNSRRRSAGDHVSPPVVVIGAGPTGLSAAYHLGHDALLLEQNDRVGGWCRSIEDNGFTFDFAGHIMFSNDPYVHEMYQMLLGDNVHWQDREAWVYSKNVYTRYPFQGALYGLPPEVIKECILGAIEARFGPLTKPETTTGRAAAANGPAEVRRNGHAATNGKNTRGSDSWCEPGSIHDCCADGVAEATAKLGRASGANGHADQKPDPPRNFEEFIYQVWGSGIAKHFAIPYNRKLWAVPLHEMETSWLGGRVPMPDFGEMLDGALKPVPRPMGPNARFGYPLRGGFQALMDGFLPLLKGPLLLGSRVAGISARRHVVKLDSGKEFTYQQLVSTMPLPVMVRLLGSEVPDNVRRAAAGLRNISVRCVHLGIGRPNLTEKHWIYYPEDPIFHRIFVQGNASPHCNAPGGFGLTCEITYHPHYKPLPCDGDELIKRCIEDCRRVGMIQSDDPIWAASQVDMPHAYVVYDHARPENVALIRRWLLEHDIILAGRYSEWEYYNSDHAFLAGMKAAETVRERRNSAAPLLANVS